MFIKVQAALPSSSTTHTLLSYIYFLYHFLRIPLHRIYRKLAYLKPWINHPLFMVRTNAFWSLSPLLHFGRREGGSIVSLGVLSHAASIHGNTVHGAFSNFSHPPSLSRSTSALCLYSPCTVLPPAQPSSEKTANTPSAISPLTLGSSGTPSATPVGINGGADCLTANLANPQSSSLPHHEVWHDLRLGKASLTVSYNYSFPYIFSKAGSSSADAKKRQAMPMYTHTHIYIYVVTSFIFRLSSDIPSSFHILLIILPTVSTSLFSFILSCSGCGQSCCGQAFRGNI